MNGVRLQVDGPVATLVLDRPPLNAPDVPMTQAPIEALRRVDEAPGRAAQARRSRRSTACSARSRKLTMRFSRPGRSMPSELFLPAM